MEERISSTEDIIVEIDSLVKKKPLKLTKCVTQNIQEIWDTMKRSNLKLIGIEEVQLKSTENILNKIIEENFPKLK